LRSHCGSNGCDAFIEVGFAGSRYIGKFIATDIERHLGNEEVLVVNSRKFRISLKGIVSSPDMPVPISTSILNPKSVTIFDSF